jgi:hypothetical protein
MKLDDIFEIILSIFGAAIILSAIIFILWVASNALNIVGRGFTENRIAECKAAEMAGEIVAYEGSECWIHGE